jgi:hypothetical protein
MWTVLGRAPLDEWSARFKGLSYTANMADIIYKLSFYISSAGILLTGTPPLLTQWGGEPDEIGSHAPLTMSHLKSQDLLVSHMKYSLGAISQKAWGKADVLTAHPQCSRPYKPSPRSLTPVVRSPGSCLATLSLAGCSYCSYGSLLQKLMFA